MRTFLGFDINRLWSKQRSTNEQILSVLQNLLSQQDGKKKSTRKVQNNNVSRTSVLNGEIMVNLFLVIDFTYFLISSF